MCTLWTIALISFELTIICTIRIFICFISLFFLFISLCVFDSSIGRAIGWMVRWLVGWLVSRLLVLLLFLFVFANVIVAIRSFDAVAKANVLFPIYTPYNVPYANNVIRIVYFLIPEFGTIHFHFVISFLQSFLSPSSSSSSLLLNLLLSLSPFYFAYYFPMLFFFI